MLPKNTLLIYLVSSFGFARCASIFGQSVQQVVEVEDQTLNDPSIALPSRHCIESERLDRHGKKKCHTVTSNRVRHRLKDADIIPAVIGDFIPSFLLNISFHSNQSPFLGSTLEPPMLQEAPKANLYSPPRKHHSRHSSNSQSAISTIVAKLPLNNLVVAMTDPDAPSRANPKWGEICHWIAVGVPVNISSSASGVSTKGQLNPDAILKELMPYKPPGPPPKTGKHRYVLLAFTPKNGTSFPLDLVKPVDRMHWGYGMKGYGVKQWAEDMGLLPIAAEFFTAQHVA